MSTNDSDKLLAVKMINLLIIDDYLGYKTKNIGIIKKALDGIKIPEIILGLEHDTFAITRLKETILWVIDLFESDKKIIKLDLKTRIEYCSHNEPWMRDAVMDVFDACSPENTKDLEDSEINLSIEIRKRNAANELTHLIKEMYRNGVVNNQVANPEEFVKEQLTKLSEFNNSDIGTIRNLNADSQGEINLLTDEETIIADMTKAFELDREKRSGKMILKTGYRAINDMLRGGIRFGEFLLNIAMKFNYKSGLVVNIFRQVVSYNEAPVFEDGTKATIVFLTIEQDLAALYYFLYAGIIENKTRRPLTADEKNASPEAMAYVVYKHFKETGWNVVIKHQHGHKWGYEDVFAFTDTLNKNGCRVVGLFIDYLNKISTRGCECKVIGEDIKLMHTIVRDKYKLENTFVFTPYQMSRKARDWLDFGSGLLVENVAGKGMLEGCGTLDNVVDVEIYQHVETDRKSGMTALSVLRGKHKLEGELDDMSKKLALMWFNQYEKNNMYVSGILDDINHEAMYSRKLNEAPVGLSGESVVFNDNIFEAF